MIFKMQRVYSVYSRKYFRDLKLTTCDRVTRLSIEKYRVLGTHFDDDLLVNMVLKKDRFNINKLMNRKCSDYRFIAFYPSFIPIQQKHRSLSKSDFYWTANTFRYSCIKCGETKSMFYNDFKLKNFLCANCIGSHYLSVAGRFLTTYHNHIYTKNTFKIYDINKYYKLKLMDKMNVRNKSYIDKYMPKDKIIELKKESNKVSRIFRSLIE